MDPLSIGLITGGANLLGSIFSSNTSAQNTQQQIQANEQMVAQQEQFQQQMSNTAYQRASADMKAAGLNPMMMFGSGSAASTPGGASISQTVNRQSPFANLGDATSKAVSSAVAAKTMDNLTSEIAKRDVENDLLRARTAQTAQETKTEEQRTLDVMNTAQLKGLSMPGARFSAKSAEDLLSIPDWLRTSMNIGGFSGKKVGETISPALDTVSSAVGAGRLFKDIWRDRIDRGY